MELKIFEYGRLDFEEACKAQKRMFLAVKNKELPSALLLCRHHPVITMGRLAGQENILADENELSLKKIKISRAERGGDVTYHGPGQLIAYPVFDLNYIKKDIHLFLRRLEGVITSTLQHFGAKGVTYKGLTGVWIGKEKIASIGIAIRNWITFHGLSINIKKDDLDNFRLIKPCGMNVKMASMEGILNRSVEIDSVSGVLCGEFKNHF